MENSQTITETITQTINSIFEQLFSSIDNSLYSVLDDITFINSDILSNDNFERIFGTSSSNGILLIANALLFGFILYYAIRYLLCHLTYHQIDAPFSFIIKVIIFGILMNYSFFIIEFILNLCSNITLSIRTIGESLFQKNICFSELINMINTNIAIDTSSINIFSLDGLIKGTLTFSLLNLIFSYSFRYILIKVFIFISPFAFLSLTLNTTSWFFKTWAKNFFSLLFIQIIISIILLIMFSMDYSSNNLFVKFVYIGGIYTLIKANSFVREFIGGISTDLPQVVKSLPGMKR